MTRAEGLSGTAPAQLRAAGQDPVPPGSAAAPLTPVLLYAPTRRRRMWWYPYLCPVCGEPQFGRARTRGDVTGARRGGCGHWLEVVVASTFGESA